MAVCAKIFIALLAVHAGATDNGTILNNGTLKASSPVDIFPESEASSPVNIFPKSEVPWLAAVVFVICICAAAVYWVGGHMLSLYTSAVWRRDREGEAAKAFTHEPDTDHEEAELPDRTRGRRR